jgi:hypothetical protein
LLRRHWRKVQRVANGLLARKTLSAAETDALIDSVTSRDERARAKRIAAARKPLRDEFSPRPQKAIALFAAARRPVR